ncbi:MAG: hypothetical protein LBT64_02525 [Puniceicoccales bacterium]|jgi:hypothetical protein|nr:hypothetical protein [Puniceicoccales bacterium]
MDKVFELYNELVRNKVFKLDMKNFIGKGIAQLDKLSKFLKSEDPDRIASMLVKHIPEAMMKGYREGKLSEESVESARQVALLYPNEATKKVYELHKQMYEFCKESDNNKSA